jgi:ribosomal protein S18 acetylase RimI-like enzyme
MSGEFIIREANAGDKHFIAEAILNAEKSGTEKLGLSTLFDLPEPELEKIILQILDEESTCSEFSLDSFMVAEHKGQPVAAMAGWIESFGNCASSASVKSNFIHFFFPRKNLMAARPRIELLKNILIPRGKNCLQIEYVYVLASYRGEGLAGKLIDRHILNAQIRLPELNKAQVQVFSNNKAAIRLYEKSGFASSGNFKASNKEILDYLPFDEKILMERKVRG